MRAATGIVSGMLQSPSLGFASVWFSWTPFKSDAVLLTNRLYMLTSVISSFVSASCVARRVVPHTGYTPN